MATATQPAPPAPENDPVVASYSVLLNPSLPHGRKLWVLQQPNRTDLAQAAPAEMRVKQSTGMVEVDVPLDYRYSYNRDKGMHYGRHLKNSLTAKQGGTHGLSGGFGVGAPPPQQQRGKKGAQGQGGGFGGGSAEDDELFMDWGEAVRQDKVLRTLTLGGQCPDFGEVQYMIGVFQGKDLHLTPVSNLVHLRPQLHHLDAVNFQERTAAASASKEQGAGGAGGAGPNGAAPGGAGAGAANAGARAIHMTIKQGGDNDVATTETMIDRLRAVQREEWRRLKFTDENDEGAWDVYQESLILSDEQSRREAAQAQAAAEAEAEEEEKKKDHDKEAAEVKKDDEDVEMQDIDPVEKEDKEGKGKGKLKEAVDAEQAANQDEEEKKKKPPVSDIAERIAKLSTTWDDEHFLEAISGIVKPKPLAKEQENAANGGDQAPGSAGGAASSVANAGAATRGARGGARARGRGARGARGAGAAAARGRGGARTGGSGGDAMDLT